MLGLGSIKVRRRQWRASIGALGLPVAFGCGVGLQPMVVTIWSHLWVVSGPARSLLITVSVSRPFAGSYRRKGLAVLGYGMGIFLYVSLGWVVLGKGSVPPHDKMRRFDSRQWRTSVGAWGCP